MSIAIFDDVMGDRDDKPRATDSLAPDYEQSEDTSLDEQIKQASLESKVMSTWDAQEQLLADKIKAIIKEQQAKLLQVIEDEVIGDDILMDNGTPVNHTLHNFRTKQRQVLKELKDNGINGGSL